MKKRSKRQIEIFSLSSIDLFAAAMGAFALLTIVLIPYYQKEIQERTPENAVADLARAAEESALETQERRKALAKKRSAMQSNVSDIKRDETELLAELRAAEAALKEKRAEAERAVVIPVPIEEEPAPAPEKAKIPFRFLGMKTKKDDIVMALDMNRCMGGHEASIREVMRRIIQSLQDNHRLKIIGFQQVDSGPKIQSWPRSASLERMLGQSQAEAIKFSEQLTTQFGGSASMLDAFKQMLEGPGEAIFLVSDGLPNPRVNQGLTPSRLATQITFLNNGRKEIHTVVVGNYFDYHGTVEFMEKLAAQNDGQFMALASSQTGICD